MKSWMRKSVLRNKKPYRVKIEWENLFRWKYILDGEKLNEKIYFQEEKALKGKRWTRKSNLKKKKPWEGKVKLENLFWIRKGLEEE